MSEEPIRYEVRRDGVHRKGDDAVWQYILDHANPSPSGHMRVSFFLKDRNEWDRRINARRNGVYRRSEFDMEKDWKSFENAHTAFVVHRNMQAEFNRRVSSIDNNGSVIEKGKLWLFRKLRKHLGVNSKKSRHTTLKNGSTRP